MRAYLPVTGPAGFYIKRITAVRSEDATNLVCVRDRKGLVKETDTQANEVFSSGISDSGKYSGVRLAALDPPTNLN